MWSLLVLLCLWSYHYCASVVATEHSTCTTTTSTPANAFASIVPSESLKWNPCFEDKDQSPFGGVYCARLIAPLDYSNVTSGQAQLAIIKLAAKTNGSVSNAKSPVFFNPGGPGGDPVKEFLSGAASRVWATYVPPGHDIIGVVPRSIGSTFPPAGCYFEQATRVSRLRDLSFKQELGYNNASLEIMDTNAVGFGIDCATVSGHVLPHMGTFSTVEDMNYVLGKLGEERLNYVGFSYGTVIGATFAALCPDKINHLVLDGVRDSNDWFSSNPDPRLNIGDVDITLDSFFTTCFEAGSAKCALWAPRIPEIRAKFWEADRRIHQRPINVPQLGLFEFPQWRYAAYNALYQPTLLFQTLAGLTAEVYSGVAGDAIAGILKAQNKTGIPSDIPLTEKNLSNGIESLWMVQCLDSGLEFSCASAASSQLFNRFRDVSELGRNNANYGVVCQRFPIRSKRRLQKRIENVRTYGKILFVGNTADPTTPLRNAVSMNKAFPGSALLIINGTGHSSSLADPDLKCGSEYITPYLATGVLPPNGTICQGRKSFFN